AGTGETSHSSYCIGGQENSGYLNVQAMPQTPSWRAAGAPAMIDLHAGPHGRDVFGCVWALLLLQPA
ncbi:MAG TPA: hypothetical protein P5114_11090, partial [Hyphomicrobiaceae bacterium]|nr:hypothetical protein [Hyphomicrobiaceae bacterium]